MLASQTDWFWRHSKFLSHIVCASFSILPYNESAPDRIVFEAYLSLLDLNTPRSIAITASLLSLLVELMLEIQSKLSYGSRVAL
jgi:hypothetical protein